MKKLFSILLAIAMVATMMTFAVSAELYSPKYYGALKVADGAITVDGVVDEAYGEPLFYYTYDPALAADPGDISSTANWFFTGDTSSDDCRFLAENEENFAYGYVVWTNDAMYVCVDMNIQGWQFDGVAEDGSDMWKAYCVQLSMFDYDNNSNVDWGMGVDKTGAIYQYNFGQNNGSGTPTMADGVTNFNVKATREGEHVIYETELPYEKFLSFVPKDGDFIGLDVCIDFCELSIGGPQQCLTFVNENYHARNSATARHLYFVEEKATADKLYGDTVNAAELKGTEHSISLHGCNEAFGGFQIDTENAQAGFACLTTGVGQGFINEVKFDAVDGSKFDTLEFDLYVSDIALFDKFAGEGMNSGLELSSAGRCDNSEISWNLAKMRANNKGKALVNGWNHIVLYMSGADTENGDTGAFDKSAINYIRFFMVNEKADTGITVKIDNFRLTDAEAVKIADDKAAAKKVEDKILALDEVTTENYSSLKTKVNSAKSAYDKLTDEVKAYVSAEAVTKLTTAVNLIEEYINNPPEEKEPTTEPTADPTTNPTTNPTTDPTVSIPEKEGCKSVVASGAVIVMIASIAGGALIFKKKEN